MNNQSDLINELAAALAKAQAEIKNAEEDKNNPHFKSKYATLASIWDACRGPLSKHGLSISQFSQLEEGKPVFVTMLMHSSGQWIRSAFPVMPSLKIQETGSQITYLRRYFLSSIAGVAPGEVLDDDDDGEKAMGRAKKEEPKEPLIGDAEYAELMDLIKKVTPAFKKNLEALFNQNGIGSYKQVTKTLFLNQKPLILEHIKNKEKNES